jgi:hypothetical protein
MSEGIQKLKQATKNFEQAFRKAQEQYQESFVVALQETVFAHNPFVEKVTWTQYANFYCDGGPCDFYVDSDSCRINNEEPFYSLEEDEEDPHSIQVFHATKTLNSFLQNLSDALMKQTFGGDQKITVYRDGKIENDYYGGHG